MRHCTIIKEIHGLSMSRSTISNKRLAYGLKVSGGYFNYLVSQALQSDDLLSSSVLNYVDDLLVFTESVSDHIKVMRRLFMALENAGLKIHNQKCSLFQKKVKFLGHVITANGIETQPDKLQAMLN